jgi:hypothetical protein
MEEYLAELDVSRNNSIRGKRSQYKYVDNQERLQLLYKVLISEEPLSKAAKTIGIKFTTAKSILNLFQSEGRINRMLRFKTQQNFYKRVSKSDDLLKSQ